MAVVTHSRSQLEHQALRPWLSNLTSLCLFLTNHPIVSTSVFCVEWGPMYTLCWTYVHYVLNNWKLWSSANTCTNPAETTHLYTYTSILVPASTYFFTHVHQETLVKLKCPVSLIWPEHGKHIFLPTVYLLAYLLAFRVQPSPTYVWELSPVLPLEKTLSDLVSLSQHCQAIKT